MTEEQKTWEISTTSNNCIFKDENMYCCHPDYIDNPNPDIFCDESICPDTVGKVELDYPLNPARQVNKDDV